MANTYLARPALRQDGARRLQQAPRTRRRSKLALYLVQLASLLFTRRWKFGRRHLSYPLVRADLRLRRSILRSSLPLDDFDMVIGEHPAESELVFGPDFGADALRLHDPVGRRALLRGHADRATSTAAPAPRGRDDRGVDLLSFSWETYAPYSVEHYGISGRNFCQLNWGCTPVTAAASASSDPPRIILLSSLSSNFINLPLLSRLSKLYPIDVYGGPPPDPALGINYLGWAPPSVLRRLPARSHHLSKDPLRRNGFSAKNTAVHRARPARADAGMARAHAPAPRLGPLRRGELPSTVIERLSDEDEWQRVSDEAYAQAQELAWEKTLEPLDRALRDSGYRHLTPYMKARVEGERAAEAEAAPL